ncbi:MAG: GEVED domain-containing protein [Halobacteria archaeon]
MFDDNELGEIREGKKTWLGYAEEKKDSILQSRKKRLGVSLTFGVILLIVVASMFILSSVPAAVTIGNVGGFHASIDEVQGSGIVVYPVAGGSSACKYRGPPDGRDLEKGDTYLPLIKAEISKAEIPAGTPLSFTKDIKTPNLGFLHNLRINITRDVDIVGPIETLDYSPPNTNEYKKISGQHVWVDRIQLNSINQRSTIDTGDGYKNLTNVSTNLIFGKTYDLNLTIGQSNDERVAAKAWIDFNRDGNFNKHEETLDDLGSCEEQDCSVSQEIDVPESAKKGASVIRVAVKKDTNRRDFPNPDGRIRMGEFEDYGVYFTEEQKADPSRYPTSNGTDNESYVRDISIPGVLNTGNTTSFGGYVDATGGPTATVKRGDSLKFDITGVGSVGTPYGPTWNSSYGKPSGDTSDGNVLQQVAYAGINAPQPNDKGYVNATQMHTRNLSIGEKNELSAVAHKVGKTRINIGKYPGSQSAGDTENDNGEDTWIEQVKFAGINTGEDGNTGGYKDYTETTSTKSLEAGESKDVNVWVTSSAGNTKTDVRAFIDWDQDGDFDKSAEKINVGKKEVGNCHWPTGCDKETKKYHKSVTVPDYAKSGTTLMRVISKTGDGGDPGYPSFTENNWAGEKDDFSVTVAGEAHIKAWIDWNHNGKFDDTPASNGGEAYSIASSKSSKTVFQGNVSVKVPEDARHGPTTMRVMTAQGFGDSGVPTPDKSDFSGQTEDFSVYVNPAPSKVDVKIDWDDTGSFSDDEVYPIGTVGNRSNLGIYEVKRDKGDKVPDSVEPGPKLMRITAYQPPPSPPGDNNWRGETEDFTLLVQEKGNASTLPTGYGEPKAGNEWIKEAGFAGLNLKTKPSESGYDDQTKNTSAKNITKGKSMTLSVDIGKAFYQDTSVKAWIDWNKDQKLQSNEEYKVGNCSPKDCSVSEDIEVPYSAVSGATLMRVMMKRDGYPGKPYGAYGSGEAEDLTVNVAPYTESSGSAGGDWIDKFELEGLDYRSGSGDDNKAYVNNTDYNTSNLTRSVKHTANISVGSDSGGKKFIRTWVDWNQDGSFRDEKPINGTCSGAGCKISLSFIPPRSARAGPTRMRVSVASGNYSEYNETGFTGQVQDYTLKMKKNAVELGNAAVMFSGLSADRLNIGGDLAIDEQNGEYTFGPRRSNLGFDGVVGETAFFLRGKEAHLIDAQATTHFVSFSRLKFPDVSMEIETNVDNPRVKDNNYCMNLKGQNNGTRGAI